MVDEYKWLQSAEIPAVAVTEIVCEPAFGYGISIYPTIGEITAVLRFAAGTKHESIGALNGFIK